MTNSIIINGTPVTPWDPTLQGESGSVPLLPLDTFREYLQYNPWHFWGFSNSKVPVESECNDLLYEYSWQHSQSVGRSEIRRGILNAESFLKTYLGFSVAPRYTEETIPYMARNRRAKMNVGYVGASIYSQVGAGDVFGQWTSVEMSEGHISAVGLEQLTSIGDASVTLQDLDGDGLKESFVASVATSETDPRKIAAYFSDSDRLNSETVSEKWRIQPVKISISGGVCYIRGKAWILGKPVLYEGVSKAPLDPDLSTNFVSSLEVYRRDTYTAGTDYTTSQAMFIWETLPAPQWWGIWISQLSTDPAAIAYSIARCGLRDSKNGVVIPGEAVYDATTGLWQQVLPPWGMNIRRPDRVTVRYLAGMPFDPDGQMNVNLRAAVAHFAMAELPAQIAACDTALRELHHWQFDLSRIGSPQEQYAVTKRELDNPFGTRRGHADAWNRVKHLRMVRGIAV